jgi:hypothetical protein
VNVDLSRLRPGEVLAGVGGVLLMCWTGRQRSSVVRGLSLLTSAGALALPCAQATRRAPALPVALSVIVSALGATTVLGLLGRVSVVRGRARPPGEYLGLLAAVTIALGGYASMRQESGTDLAELGELETITLEA